MHSGSRVIVSSSCNEEVSIRFIIRGNWEIKRDSFVRQFVCLCGEVKNKFEKASSVCCEQYLITERHRTLLAQFRPPYLGRRLRRVKLLRLYCLTILKAVQMNHLIDCFFFLNNNNLKNVEKKNNKFLLTVPTFDCVMKQLKRRRRRCKESKRIVCA